MVYGTRHSEGSGLFDSATMCLFSSFPFYPIWGPPSAVARKFINTVCGWQLTDDDIDAISRRNDYLGRCISLREGYHPDKHANLPQRAL